MVIAPSFLTPDPSPSLFDFNLLKVRLAMERGAATVAVGP
jgi:hypothetical protein